MEYLKEDENEKENENNDEQMKIDRFTYINYNQNSRNLNVRMNNKNSFYGITDEQYSMMKQLPSSRSTATLLKGYNRRPLSAVFQ